MLFHVVFQKILEDIEKSLKNLICWTTKWIFQQVKKKLKLIEMSWQI